MRPKRILKEIQTYAKLNKKTCHIIVEGESDRVILSSFCNESKIEAIVYDIPGIDLDPNLAKVENGNRGRVLSVAEALRGDNVPRMFCVIDRDGDRFEAFYLHSHCLVTDFASLEMYALDIERFSGHVSRAYLVDLNAESINSILNTSRTASFLKWTKEEYLKGISLAEITKSLSFDKGIVSIDVQGWINRSRSAGGNAEAWRAIAHDAARRDAAASDKTQADIDIHLCDEIFRFWLRSAKGEALKPRWLEQFLRGEAIHNNLVRHKFFDELRACCCRGVECVQQ